ncbi:MAG: ABC transporter permease [Acidobacteria bacterium]|nr:ABC transporter permease [Acidobacteriota bacterium]
MAILTLAVSFWKDFTHGLRLLRLNPGFAGTAVLSLALGIAANTSIFTLVDQIILRMLPVENPKELVQFRMEGGRFGSQNGDGRHTFSYPLYVDFREKNTVFSGLTGQYFDRVSLTAGERSDMADVSWVAGNFFTMLGVRPHIGRVLTAEDDDPGKGSPAVVLQYDFWQSRYAGDRNVVGSTIRLNGSPFTVAGVASPEFGGTGAGQLTQVWVPVTMRTTLSPDWTSELKNERSAWFYLFARLKPGVTIDQAQSAMRVLHDQRKQEELKGQFFLKFPDTKDRFLRQTLSLIPADRGMSQLRSTFEKPLVVLQWLVGIVLLIACTNVANLHLARAAARQREIAIRSALGASRAQMVRQLFVESSILAVAGGAGGLLLSSWLARGLVRFLPYDPSTLSLSTAPDTRVLLFTMAITLATALIFGLVPAFRGSNVPASTTLKEEAGSVTGGHGHVRMRKTFVALQVALSALLLIGAGLFVRTLDNLRNVRLGFDVENVLMFGVRPATQYSETRKLQMFRSLVEGLATVPGVKSVGANSSRLLTGGRWDSQISIPGVAKVNGQVPASFFNAVTPGYFETLGIPIKLGRDFSWRDWGGSRKVALVNEALVKQYFDGANPVGRQMAQGRDVPADTEIIGVFGNARYHDVRGEIPPQTFLNIDGRMRFVGSVNVYARIQGDPRVVMPALREQVRRVDSNLVVFDMRMMDDQLNRRLANERMLSYLSGGFAFLATLLAVVGLHGVLAFVVTRRTREIGIRIALGAGQGTVIQLVMREMSAVILMGLAAGVITALVCGRYVETQLFGVKALDVPVIVISIVLLLAASLIASLLPAWRASRISPIRALRWE